MTLKNLFPTLTAWVALCLSAAPSNAQYPLSQQTQDGMLHILAHEIGHAVLREFDLPILGPEEAIADDFATLYVYRHFPERAEDIISARARQNMADGHTAEAFSEYTNDTQRAGRSVCLLYGQDPDTFSGLAQDWGLDGDAAAGCRDFSTEVARSWRRVLAEFEMPDTARITEVGFSVEEAPFPLALAQSGFREDAHQLLAGIDWHSKVRLVLKQCDGSSWYARNGRRITICSDYIRRFETQLSK